MTSSACSAKKRCFTATLSSALWRTDSSKAARSATGSCGAPDRNGYSSASGSGIGVLEFAQLLEQRQGARRLLGIDTAHGEAGVHQHPIADALRCIPVIEHEGDVHWPAHAADLHH